MRHIGVDLHTTQITVCYLTENEAIEIKKYQLCEIEKFVFSLSKTEEVVVTFQLSARLPDILIAN